MNIAFQKIGIGLDGSEASYRALKEALDLAQKLGAKVIGLHVLPIPADLAEMGAPIVELEAELRKEAEAILDRGREEAEKAGVSYEGAILEGRAAEALAEYGEKEGFDLIVVGYQGKSKLSELIMGSVTSRLLSISKVPLLVVK